MIHPDILNLRKELHQHPELSGFEQETAARIKNFLLAHQPARIIENIGGHGLAAVYSFPEEGKSVTIRCELDALPIPEENDFEHRSRREGVSHKCGHDGHMAIVAGLAPWLKEQKFAAGEVILLFQPAEENGKGAEQVVKDERFQTEHVFALHNIPKVAMHEIILPETGFSAEVESFVIRLKGKSSHASEPENGVSPALAISEIITTMDLLQVKDPTKEDFCLITPVHLNMGQVAYGISPADGELHYTMRSWNGEIHTAVKSAIKKKVQEICQVHGLRFKMEWLEYFPAAINDPLCKSYIEKAAVANDLKISRRPQALKFGEDFGWYTKEYKTAMFGLGAGLDTPALHNADYDFPDELIETGMEMFKKIIRGILQIT